MIGKRITLAELEMRHISAVMQSSSSLDEAAEILGLNPSTLYRKRKDIEDRIKSGQFKKSVSELTPKFEKLEPWELEPVSRVMYDNFIQHLDREHKLELQSLYLNLAAREITFDRDKNNIPINFKKPLTETKVVATVLESITGE